MYMLYQQYTTAVQEAYKGHPNLEQQATQAKQCREWLESLEIDPQIRTVLVEQFQTLEQAFYGLLARERDVT